MALYVSITGLYPVYISGCRVTAVDRPVLPLLGAPRAERADAVRNRRQLLATAREMLAEQGVDKLTMDALAERACLGKGTVYRRFGTRAGIFQALIEDDERVFQERILSGPPPLGPGAPPLDRLIAYGQARSAFLIEHREIVRAAVDGRQPVPAGTEMVLSRMHIGMLLRQLSLDVADLDVLAIQLTAALEAPLLLYLSAAELIEDAVRTEERTARGWQELIRRVCRP